MPSVTGGWPFHLPADSVEEWAETSQQIAMKLAAALPGRAQGEASRTAEASGGAGVWVPLAPTLTLADAPAGVYVVTVSGMFRRAGGAGTTVQLGITVGPTTVFERTVAEVVDDLTRTIGQTRLIVHAGGQLQVAAAVRGVTAGVFAHAGSVIGAVRVSA